MNLPTLPFEDAPLDSSVQMHARDVLQCRGERQRKCGITDSVNSMNDSWLSGVHIK